MKQTSNLGLALYEPDDNFSITTNENSLNHNMEIIDKAFPIRQTIIRPGDNILEKKAECLAEGGTKCLRFTPGIYEINHSQSIKAYDGNEALHFRDVNGLTIIIDKGAIIKNILTVKDLTKTIIESSEDIYQKSRNKIINNYKGIQLNEEITENKIKEEIKAALNEHNIKYGIENVDITLEIQCDDDNIITGIECISKNFKYKWFNPDIIDDTNNPNGIDKSLTDYRSRIAPLLQLNTPKTFIFNFTNCSNITICGGGSIQGLLSEEEWYKNSLIPVDTKEYNQKTGRVGDRLHNYYYSDWISQSVAIKINGCENIRIKDIEIGNFFGRGINIGMLRVTSEKYTYDPEHNKKLSDFTYGYMANYSQLIRNELDFIVTPQIDEGTTSAYGIVPSRNVRIQNVNIHHTLAEAFMLTGAQDVIIDNVNIWETGSKLSYGFDIEGGIYFGPAGPRDNYKEFIILEKELPDITKVKPHTLYLLPICDDNNNIIHYEEYEYDKYKMKLNFIGIDNAITTITGDIEPEEKTYHKFNPVIPSNKNIIIQNCYVKNSISTYPSMTWAAMVGKCSENIIFENVVGVDAGFFLDTYDKLNIKDSSSEVRYEPDFYLRRDAEQDSYTPILVLDIKKWYAEVNKPKNVKLKNCKFPTTVCVRDDIVIDGGEIQKFNIQHNAPDSITPSNKITDEYIKSIVPPTDDNESILIAPKNITSEEEYEYCFIHFPNFNEGADQTCRIKLDIEKLKALEKEIYLGKNRMFIKDSDNNIENIFIVKKSGTTAEYTISWNTTTEGVICEKDKTEVKNLQKPLLFASFKQNSCEKIIHINVNINTSLPFIITTNDKLPIIKNVSGIKEIIGSDTTSDNQIQFIGCNFNTVSGARFLKFLNGGFKSMSFKDCDFILNAQNPTSGIGLNSTIFTFNDCNFTTSYSGAGPYKGGVLEARSGILNIQNCVFDLTSIKSNAADIEITLIGARESKGKIYLCNNKILTQNNDNLSINKTLIKKHNEITNKEFAGEIVAFNNIALNVHQVLLEKEEWIKLTEASRIDLRDNKFKIV